MLKNALLAGSGGFIGSVIRYGITVFSNKVFTKSFIPPGTLFVNVAGCYLIGMITLIVKNTRMFSNSSQIFLVAGFLGGFTTFSTFGNETLIIGQKAGLSQLFLNLFLHLFLGLSAVYLGQFTAKNML